MRRGVLPARWTALLCALPSLVVLACGGKPAGGKLPRPNPTDVAFVAAAAAAATTLANPKAAAQKPEKDDDPREMRDPPKTDETVPADVLDRADDAPPGPDAGVDGGAPPPAARCAPFLEGIGACPREVPGE